MSQRKDPFRSSGFLLEIDGIVQACFSEVTFPDVTTNVIEYRSGDDDSPSMGKLPGLKLSNIVLKRGITNSTELFKWYKDIMDGRIRNSRKNFSILILDDQGNEAERWNLVRAWPTKYYAHDLNAKNKVIGECFVSLIADQRICSVEEFICRH